MTIPVKTRVNTTIKAPVNLSSKLVRLKPSRFLLGVVIFIHLASVLAILLTRLPFWLQSMAVVLLITHLGYHFHQWRISLHYRLQKFQQYWRLVSESSLHSKTATAEDELTILDLYYWSRWLVILRVENNNGRKYYFPIFFDSCTPEGFHHIRVVSKTML